MNIDAELRQSFLVNSHKNTIYGYTARGYVHYIMKYMFHLLKVINQISNFIFFKYYYSKHYIKLYHVLYDNTTSTVSLLAEIFDNV